MSHGLSVDEARQNLEDAQREYLAALQERQLAVPAPSVPTVVAVVTWNVVTPRSGSPEVSGSSVHLVTKTEILAPA
jgi:hypothetical protein